MPRFFIDFWDGEDFVEDQQGSDCLDVAQAQAEAVGLLTQAARDRITEQADRSLRSVVRDAEERSVFQATLSFRREVLAP